MNFKGIDDIIGDIRVYSIIPCCLLAEISLPLHHPLKDFVSSHKIANPVGERLNFVLCASLEDKTIRPLAKAIKIN